MLPIYPVISFLGSYPEEVFQKKEKAVYIETFPAAQRQGWQNDLPAGKPRGQIQPEACFNPANKLRAFSSFVFFKKGS